MQLTNRIRSTFRAAFLLASICFSCYASAGPQDSTEHALPVNPPTTRDTLLPPGDRKPVPDFQLRDNRGHLFRLSQQRGKVVIVNFWATWCGGCKFELPYFVGYDHKYRKQGLTTVGVAMDDEGFSVVKPFWKSKHMPYLTVVGSESLGKSLGLTGMPFTLLIDKEGRAAIAHNGVIDRQDFEDHIQQLLRS